MESDERLLLLQQRRNPLEQESLARFADAGIKTVRISPWVSWHECEPEPGEYNWDAPDRIIDTARSAGLKVAVHLYDRAPDWLEEGKIEYFYNEGTPFGPQLLWGGSWLAVDPFNTYAREKEAEFLEVALEHLTVPGEVECSYAMPYDAERILPFGLGEYTEKMCVDLVVERQRIFARYSSELWTAFHPHHADGRGSVDGSTHPHVGNEHTFACYEAMRATFPEHTLNRILYMFFMPDSPLEPSPTYVKHWVGAEYAANVVAHAMVLDSLGVWGMVMAHSHDHYDPRQPYPGEYEEVAKAIEILSRRQV